MADLVWQFFAITAFTVVSGAIVVAISYTLFNDPMLGRLIQAAYRQSLSLQSASFICSREGEYA